MNLHDAIIATFAHPKVEAIRKAIRKQEDGWDWHEGGCFGVARIISQVVGSKAKLMGIVFHDEDGLDLPWATDHAIVKVAGKYYDWRGELTMRQIRKEYFTRTTHTIKSHNAKGVWFGEDYYLCEHYALISNILKGFLTR